MNVYIHTQDVCHYFRGKVGARHTHSAPASLLIAHADCSRLPDIVLIHYF